MGDAALQKKTAQVEPTIAKSMVEKGIARATGAVQDKKGRITHWHLELTQLGTDCLGDGDRAWSYDINPDHQLSVGTVGDVRLTTVRDFASGR